MEDTLSFFTLFFKPLFNYMKQQLRDFIFEELVFVDDPKNFKDDDNLLEAGLDSMGIMRLIMFIEECFAVTLPDDEIDPDNIETFNRLEKWILRHQ
jgi:acyl carrier protein